LIIWSTDAAGDKQPPLRRNLLKRTSDCGADPTAGPRQTRGHDESELRQEIDVTLQKFDVSGLLSVALETRETTTTKYVARDEEAARAKTQDVSRRYFVQAISRNETAIARRKEFLGWRAQATNCSRRDCLWRARSSSIARLVFGAELSRGEGQALGIAPMFVHNDDQINGLTHCCFSGRGCFRTSNSVRGRNSRIAGRPSRGCTRATDAGNSSPPQRSSWRRGRRPNYPDGDPGGTQSDASYHSAPSVCNSDPVIFGHGSSLLCHVANN